MRNRQLHTRLVPAGQLEDVGPVPGEGLDELGDVQRLHGAHLPAGLVLVQGELGGGGSHLPFPVLRITWDPPPSQHVMPPHTRNQQGREL